MGDQADFGESRLPDLYLSRSLHADGNNAGRPFINKHLHPFLSATFDLLDLLEHSYPRARASTPLNRRNSWNSHRRCCPSGSNPGNRGLPDVEKETRLEKRRPQKRAATRSQKWVCEERKIRKSNRIKNQSRSWARTMKRRCWRWMRRTESKC